MAKALQRSTPTSSVANLLDPGVGAHAIGRAEITSSRLVVTPSPHAGPPNSGAVLTSSTLEPTGEVPDIPRQFTLTASTDRTLKKMIDAFAEATGLELHFSEMLRAILHATAAAMPELHQQARQIGKLKRPKNDRGREAQREALERRIARAFAAALRASPDA